MASSHERGFKTNCVSSSNSVREFLALVVNFPRLLSAAVTHLELSLSLWLTNLSSAHISVPCSYRSGDKKYTERKICSSSQDRGCPPPVIIVTCYYLYKDGVGHKNRVIAF